MESEAYTLRHSDEKFKTRVKMGMINLILYKKKPSEKTWTIVPDNPSWPSVNLTPDTYQSDSKTNSPPPGRPPLAALYDTNSPLIQSKKPLK